MAIAEAASAPEKDNTQRSTSIQSIAQSVIPDHASKEIGSHVKGDIAEELFREIEAYTPEELEAEQIKVRKLLDWRIMPIVCL